MKYTRFETLEDKKRFLPEDEKTNLDAPPLSSKVGDLFERFVAANRCTRKVTASYIPMKKGRFKIATLRNFRTKRELNIYGKITNHTKSPLPKSDSALSFQIAGKEESAKWKEI